MVSKMNSNDLSACTKGMKPLRLLWMLVPQKLLLKVDGEFLEHNSKNCSICVADLHLYSLEQALLSLIFWSLGGEKMNIELHSLIFHWKVFSNANSMKCLLRY